MAKNAYSDWDSTAGNNLDLGGTSIAEGCAAGNINNAIREMMAQLAAWDVVGRTETQTLTNKTLTAPTISGEMSGGTIADPDITGTATITASTDRDILLEDGVMAWGAVGQDYITWSSTNGFLGYENGSLAFRIGSGASTLISSVYSNTTADAVNVSVNSSGLIRRSTSSGQWKTNFAPVDGSVVLDLNPVFFTSLHKDDDKGTRYAGFIAEEVAEAFPEAAADGGKNYDTRAIVAALVAMVKQQEQRICALEAGV